MYLLIVAYRSSSANAGQIGGQGRKDPDGVRAQPVEYKQQHRPWFSLFLPLPFHFRNQSS